MMNEQIDLVATGANIRRLRTERGITVAEIQEWLGLASPRIIYKWQKGDSIPSVDNLVALSRIFNTSMNEIIIINRTATAPKEQ